MPKIVYGDKPETILKSSLRKNSSTKNHVLMGTYLEVIEEQDSWYHVKTRHAGSGGWVQKKDVRDDPGLKVFYVDVGQGDGALIEHPDGIMVIDGGPGSNLYRFMKNRYRPLIATGEKVHIQHMVVSHPDQDHYESFIPLLNDPSFTFGTIYHNGIIRYHAKNMPADRTFDLGTISKKTVNGRKEHVLTETFSTLNEIKQIHSTNIFRTPKGNPTVFGKFWKAALDAEQAGRLQGAKRLTVRDKTLPGLRTSVPNKLYVEIWGPVPTKMSGSVEYTCFPGTEDMKPDRKPNDNPPSAESSHTRNGHSVVLKLHFGKHSFLFGGDLNIPAQCHLLDHFGDENPFRCDVAKACHHGSSDFHADYLKRVRPHVNVISSGDNKTFDHPVADSVGALGRHTSGNIPLLFSTELARAVPKDLKKRKIHFGLINARSNGKILTMAQMKEVRRSKDIWDSFTVPWKGKFAEILEKKAKTERIR